MSRLNYRLLLWFYPLLLIVSYFQARGIIPPYYEPLTGRVMIPFSLVVIYLGVIYFINNRRNIPVLGIYFLYTLITVVSYAFNERPIILYFQDVAYVLSTMIIAFVAVDKFADERGKFYKILFCSWVICFIIGFYLYFIRPEWYTNAIIEKHSLSSWKNQMLSIDQILEQFRFGSFTLDSYAVSFMSMYLFPLGIYYYFNSKTIWKWIPCLAIIIIIAASIFCMQRIAVVCILGDIFLLYMIGDKKIKRTMAYVIVIIISLLIIFGGYFAASDGIGEKIVEGFGSERMDDAVSGSRLSQIKDAFAELQNPIIGQGAGALGGRARELGLSGVSDCCWVKIFCEQGLIGFTLFVVLMFITLRRAFSYRQYFCVEICAIINILIAMMVSDPMFYQRYILPFWFMVGKIWNKSYLENAVGVK